MVLTKSLERLSTGDKAPDFNLKGIDGKNYTLNYFKDAKALLVIFMCNHCPYVKPKIETIKNLQAKYGEKGLVVVGINPNDPENYPEDSFDGMVNTAKEKNFNFIYLHDETQEVAKSYGASCTPDPFLFDSSKKLVYHGRFDDALEPGQEPTTADMDDAISAVLEGKKPKHEFLYSIGCSIKWRK
ncbi:thioredoxin family protein [Candidatus Woesearchaeota archaeon]|nr:thioredoxin family protein [Candidatus Woesearchaeota archaeon]